MDDPILPFLSSLPSLPDVALPFFSTTIDLTFDGLDVDAGDFAATWLRREAEAADSAEASASASSSRGAAAPQRAPRVRSSGHRVHAPFQHHHRSRSPPIFFPSRITLEAMRDALVGSARRHGLALWTLPGDMPYAAVEQACRRRILSVICVRPVVVGVISVRPVSAGALLLSVARRALSVQRRALLQ